MEDLEKVKKGEKTETIGFSGKDISNNKEPYINAIIAAYRYHRRKMPLIKTSELPQRFYHWKEIDHPIKEINNQFLINSGQYLRMELITALQRIIDACDNQRERVIDEEYRRRRIELTEREIDTEMKTLQRLSSMMQYSIQHMDSKDLMNWVALKKWFDGIWHIYEGLKKNKGGRISDCINKTSQRRKEVKDILDYRILPWIKMEDKNFNKFREINLIFDYGNKKKMESGLRDLESALLGVVQRVWVEENKANGNEKQYYLILTEWLSCCNKIIFKMIQERHFDLHNRVNAVFFWLVNPINSKKIDVELSIPLLFRFRIAIELRKDVKWDPPNPPDTQEIIKNDIIREIKKEILSCKQVLKTDKWEICIYGVDIYQYGEFDKQLYKENF